MLVCFHMFQCRFKAGAKRHKQLSEKLKSVPRERGQKGLVRIGAKSNRNRQLCICTRQDILGILGLPKYDYISILTILRLVNCVNIFCP